MSYATCKPHAVTRLVTDSTVEPVSADEAATHLRLTDAAEDEYLTNLIKTARTYCERETNRSFTTKTWKLTLDYLPSVIYLRHPPILTLTTFAYLDSDGASDTLTSADYRLDIQSEPGRLTPAYGTSWPSTHPVSGAVNITYTAGYGAAASAVPQPIKSAILLMVEYLHFNRGSVDVKPPMAIASLLAPYTIAEYA